MSDLDDPVRAEMGSVSPARAVPAALFCLLSLAASGCTRRIEATPAAALPQYPFCPPPFERRVGPGETAIVESCGGFDESGNVMDGWEVTSYSNGVRREEHHARGKLQGSMRVWFEDGDTWIGWYEDGLLEGRREYWHSNGGKWQEAEFHRGEIVGPGRSWFPDGSLQSIFMGGAGKMAAHLEWHEDGTFYRQEGDVQALLGGKTLEEVREANHRPAYGPVARVLAEKPTGPIGSKTNPVRCHGPSGEGAYLIRLRCADGRAPKFERLGSVGFGVYGNILDEYEVNCAGETKSVFFDMYHAGHVEAVPPPGFTIQ